jgi:hypothetical protein
MNTVFLYCLIQSGSKEKNSSRQVIIAVTCVVNWELPFRISPGRVDILTVSVLEMGQLVKEFTVAYRTRRFITVFTRAHRWIVSSSGPISESHIFRILTLILRSILISSSHLQLRLINSRFPIGFPTKILYVIVILVSVSHLHLCLRSSLFPSRCFFVAWYLVKQGVRLPFT